MEEPLFEFFDRKWTDEEEKELLERLDQSPVRQQVLEAVTVALLSGFLGKQAAGWPGAVLMGAAVFLGLIIACARRQRANRQPGGRFEADIPPDSKGNTVRIFEDRMEIETDGVTKTIPYYLLFRVVNDPASPFVLLFQKGAMVWHFRRAEMPAEAGPFFAGLETRVATDEFPVPADAKEKMLGYMPIRDAQCAVPLAWDPARASRLARCLALRSMGLLALYVCMYAALLIYSEAARAARSARMGHLNPLTMRFNYEPTALSPWFVAATVGGALLILLAAWLWSARRRRKSMESLLIGQGGEGRLVIAPREAHMILPVAYRRINRGYIRVREAAGYLLLKDPGGLELPVDTAALTPEQIALLRGLDKETPEQIHQNQGGNGHE